MKNDTKKIVNTSFGFLVQLFKFIGLLAFLIALVLLLFKNWG